MNNTENAILRRYAWLALLLAVLCAFAFQGSRGIYESTEGRYAL
jgi:4-amino-4-deoxy-L-arabinose transferase